MTTYTKNDAMEVDTPVPQTETTGLQTETPAPQGEAPAPEKSAVDISDDDDEYNQAMSLPISKIKRIFKMDSDYNMASQTAVYATGVATEMFIQYFTEQAALLAKMDKRKKIQYKDFAQAVATHDNLAFLADIVPKTHPIGDLVKQKKVRATNLVETAEVSEEAVAVEAVAVESAAPVLPKGQSTLPFETASAPAPFKKAGLSDLIG